MKGVVGSMVKEIGSYRRIVKKKGLGYVAIFCQRKEVIFITLSALMIKQGLGGVDHD
jgi:hypothetical protein